MRPALLFAIAAFGALATSATAQPATSGVAACRADAATFCAGIEAGGGRRVACLIANTDKLSPACSAAIAQRTARPPTGAAAPSAPPAAAGAPPAATAPSPKGAAAAGKGRFAGCRADLQTFCASVPAGGGGKMRCLQENQAKLTPDCGLALSAVAAARQAGKQAASQACAGDAQTVCPGLKGPERRACFEANTARLSPACADALGKRAAR